MDTQLVMEYFLESGVGVGSGEGGGSGAGRGTHTSKLVSESES